MHTSVRGAPGARVQHVKILSNSCILDRCLPTAFLSKQKRFSMMNLGLKLGLC